MVRPSRSVCRVSAAIAVGSSVDADKKQIGYVISLVVVFALALVFIIPIVGRLLGFDPIVTGAWIGGSDKTSRRIFGHRPRQFLRRLSGRLAILRRRPWQAAVLNLRPRNSAMSVPRLQLCFSFGNQAEGMGRS